MNHIHNSPIKHVRLSENMLNGEAIIFPKSAVRLIEEAILLEENMPVAKNIAAAELGISTSTLDNYVSNGRIPKKDYITVDGTKEKRFFMRELLNLPKRLFQTRLDLR